MDRIKRIAVIALLVTIAAAVVYFAYGATLDDIHRSTRGDGP